MYVSPVNIKQNHYVPNFKGNKMPQAVLAKQQEVIKELDITTGTSYIAKLLKERKDAKLNDFWSQLWQNLKSSMPFADTVEKLELLKTYGISILSYTKEESSKFLQFLKSNPSDKDVFFLQTAIDIARRGQIERIENGKEHYLFDDFEPVLDYVLLPSNKKGRVNFSQFTRENIEEHLDAMHTGNYKNIGATKADANNIISTINELLAKKPNGAYYSHNKYGTKSIKSEHADKYINIGAIDVNGNTEITIGLSERIHSDYYDYYANFPIDKQLFILLDKNQKLSKLKLYSYSKKHIAEYSDDYEYYRKQEERLRKSQIFLSSYDSPFEKRLPIWVRDGYNGAKYHLKTIEYDSATKTAELKHYLYDSAYYPQKFKLVDTRSDKFGIMTDNNNPISFMSLEPTGYDLEQMINNEKTNNLIKVLDISGWKDCFMKIINESLKI